MEFRAFGDSSLPPDQYHQLIDEARAFILACYNNRECRTLNEARVNTWNKKTCRKTLEPPKLCSLPPTDNAFRENALRAHLAAAIMREAVNPDPPALTPTDHG